MRPARARARSLALVVGLLFVASVAAAAPTDWREGLMPEQIGWVERTSAFSQTEESGVEVFADMVRRGMLDDTFGPEWDTDWTAGPKGQCVMEYRALDELLGRCRATRERYDACVEWVGSERCSAMAQRDAECVERYNATCAD